ncbi:N-methylhydantoinase B/acetone carboxylase, alpha subunit [Pseudomonas sp. GM79]|uniref:hydantoinase B/oxoprolinase family protein n=1 Tax=Pseudomonas sp. GM79 TaxID=1144338 RepID=UPI00026FCA9E|nr:hydantoinase B/oxoprolinase family protein [Pseudomonas sp. GM79]EJN17881.1 N-methylhydantoinase B/acetone carboxylase, alpha subunit [Pseudomonas sp. GM79]
MNQAESLPRDHAASAANATSINPITAEFIRHSLLSIPKQIELNITRTAYSPLVYEYKDYAVGIVDPEGRLISESGGGIPLFVADALGVGVRDGLLIHGREGIKPGDVLISNHSGTLGQHLNNVIMYTPIFMDDGQLAGFMAIIMHWLDIGGWAVGSAAPIGTTSIFQEGIQFRSIKLWSEGKRVEDVYRIIESNSRFPRMLLGDIESQLAGCLLGRDMIRELVEKHTLNTFRSAIDLIWSRSEAAAREAITAIPDGVYEASSFLDDDGHDFGKPVEIKVIVRVSGDEMTVDFSGVADQVTGSINSGRFGGATTAARIAFKFLCAPHEPSNDGSYRPLHVDIPDGKFLSANGQAAMSMYSPPLPTVIDTILRAMVPAMPHHVAGGHHANFGAHVFEGRHPETGELYLAITGNHGGWGASAGHDGPGPYKTMSHGDTLDVPIEALEQLYPLRFEHYEVRPDSGGAGEYRGGVGLEKLIRTLAPTSVQLNFERSGCAPWGILGGKDAAVPETYVEWQGAERQSVMKANLDLRAGDALRVLSSGGGGYGDPLKRDLERVARDVRQGYVSVDSAREDYGVVIDAAGSVDLTASQMLRLSRLGHQPWVVC